MPGHSETKKKVKTLLGKKGTKVVNQVVKKGVNKARQAVKSKAMKDERVKKVAKACLLYTSPSPRDGLLSRMPSSA